MEYIYTAYAFSGIIKSFLNFFGISIYLDFTLLLGCLLSAGFVLNVLLKCIYKFPTKYLISMFLLLFFYLWLNTTILYSLSSEYSYQKSFLFLTNVLAFFIPIFYNKFDYKKFLKCFVVISPILGMLFLAIYATTLHLSTDTAIAFSGLYLAIPECCGISILLLIAYMELFPPSMNAIIIFFNSLVVIFASGRGPLIIVILVLGLFLIVNSFLNDKGSEKKFINTKSIFIFSIVLGVIVLLLTLFVKEAQILFDQSFKRLMILFDAASSGLEDESTMKRVEHFVFSINLIFDDIKAMLFGYGLGSYGILFSGEEGRVYPHNIILEIWFELGLTGLILFFIFFIYSCGRHIIRNPFLWPVLFLFLNSMKSNNLDDLRIFFMFLAIMLLHSEQMKSGQQALPVYCKYLNNYHKGNIVKRIS